MSARELEDRWWALSRQHSRAGDSEAAWRCAGMATAAVVERARRAGVDVSGEPASSDDGRDEATARNDLLNSCVPDNGWGYPLHPHLQGLTYPMAGMHRRSLADRLAYEEDMLDWVAYGTASGLTDAQSMHLSLYL